MVLNGLIKACEKRPVSMGRLAEIVDEVEGRLAETMGLSAASVDGLFKRLARAAGPNNIGKMTRLFLIRHGEPEAAWGGAVDDPGLSEAGRTQAAAAAQGLSAHGPLAIVSSPMRRCRETAAPYEQDRASNAIIEPRVSEVVAPAGISDRRTWLRQNFPWDLGAARKRWSEVDPALRAWRDSVVDCVLALKEDTAVFSHFIAINALASVAMRSDETIVCVPGYASITEFEVRNGALELVRLGESMVQGEVR